MKIKLEKIMESKDALSKIVDIKMPVEIAFKLSKLVNKVNDEIKSIEKARFLKVKELGEQEVIKKDGKEIKSNNWKVKEENIDKFKEEMEKLFNVEIELDIPKIKLKDLDGNVEASCFLNMDWLIKE